MSARADPCGGRSAMVVPTATSLTRTGLRQFSMSDNAWLRKLSRLLSQPGFPVVDYFRFARDPPAIRGKPPNWASEAASERKDGEREKESEPSTY
jgi:hypothetical protein